MYYLAYVYTIKSQENDKRLLNVNNSVNTCLYYDNDHDFHFNF